MLLSYRLLRGVILMWLMQVSVTGALEDVVSSRIGNWQLLDNVWLYEAGSEWHWMVGADVWIWVLDPDAMEDPQPVPVDMVLVEGGTLSTSNSRNGTVVPQFYIGRYEVTWGEWQVVRTWGNANGYEVPSWGVGCADDYPVCRVGWHDVVKWCNAKSEMEGLMPVYTESGFVYRRGEPEHISISQNLSANGYRLPLAAEWEFAARGGNQTQGYTYSGSNDLNAVGWYSGNAGGAACPIYFGYGTWPVGQKQANELGLHDMSGNVWEWCWDVDEAVDSNRVSRGGSAVNGVRGSTVSSRSVSNPIVAFDGTGFRLARSSDE